MQILSCLVIDDVSLAYFLLSKTIWKTSIPPKIQGKLNTGEVIQRKFPNMCLFPFWCVMYKASAETYNHLSLHSSL